MKTINNFINEKLKLNKQSKLYTTVLEKICNLCYEYLEDMWNFGFNDKTEKEDWFADFAINDPITYTDQIISKFIKNGDITQNEYDNKLNNDQHEIIYAFCSTYSEYRLDNKTPIYQKIFDRAIEIVNIKYEPF